MKPRGYELTPFRLFAPGIPIPAGNAGGSIRRTWQDPRRGEVEFVIESGR